MVLGLDSGRVSGSTKTPRSHSMRVQSIPKRSSGSSQPLGGGACTGLHLMRRTEMLCLRFTDSYESRHQCMITLEHWDILLQPDGAMGSSYM